MWGGHAAFLSLPKSLNRRPAACPREDGVVGNDKAALCHPTFYSKKNSIIGNLPMMLLCLLITSL